MSKYTVDLLTGFVENFEKEIHFKNKVEMSHHSQIGKIGIQLENYFCQTGVELKPSKLAAGPNPTLHVKFRRKFSDSSLAKNLIEFFVENGIKFKQHVHSGSFPLFTIKNDTIPGLLEGVGYSLFSIYAPSPTGYLGIKLEILTPNQIVKILDSKLENLSLLIWNGRTLKKSTFEFTPDIETEFSSAVLDLELISASKSNPIRIRANFTKSSLLGYTLDKILEIQKI
jgi:hypothetical protein